MRKFVMTAVAGILIGWMAPAFAVVGTTTISVTDGQSAIPHATVTVTFKNEKGRRIHRVKRRTSSSGTVRVRGA